MAGINPHKSNPPKAGESCVIAAPESFKRASLMFDRITSFPSMLQEVPKDIYFYLRDVSILTSDQGWKGMCDNLIDILEKAKDGVIAPTSAAGAIHDCMIRSEATRYQKAGLSVVPLYGSLDNFDSEFPSGDSPSHKAVLQNIPVAVENEMSWEQVQQFRVDTEALWKYRALRLWLHEGLKSETVEEASDKIQKKLYDYSWAMRKHGLKTMVGAITSVVDSKGLAALIGGAGVGAIIGGPLWSAIGSGLLLTARISTWIADRIIDREDIKRTNYAEIALIYEMNKRFK